MRGLWVLSEAEGESIGSEWQQKRIMIYLTVRDDTEELFWFWVKMKEGSFVLRESSLSLGRH